MINILKKENCVGCMACVQRCPVKCISIHKDEQGFSYPKVDISLCINCHLCEKVCPVINQPKHREPKEVYAAVNKDFEILRSSSSGGIFYTVAMKVIKEGGVVFGAKFSKDWYVVHDYTETIEGIRAFQGSKYVQSKIGNAFQTAENFLKAGRKVMFTGTPCQIAALGLFLKKDYGHQLIKMDVICHGVPSPVVWMDYLNYNTKSLWYQLGGNTVLTSLKESPIITSISFRNKRFGWEKFGFSIKGIASHTTKKKNFKAKGPEEHNDKKNSSFNIFQYHYENPFFWAFNKCYTLRPSCFACPMKSGKSLSDMTIGDFWDVGTVFPDIDRQWGVSLILVYNEEIIKLLANDVNLKPTTYQEAVRCVKSIIRPDTQPVLYENFWTDYQAIGISTLNHFFKKYRYSNKQKFIINPIKKLMGPYLFELLKKYLHK